MTWKGYYKCGDSDYPLNLIKEMVWYLEPIMKKVGQVDIVYLLLGSNDLAWHQKESPEDIADWLYTLAHKLMKQYGVKRVVFLECLLRFGIRSFRQAIHFITQEGLRTDKDVEELYAKRVHRFNERLKVWVKFDQRCSFIPMKGLHQEMRAKLYDGIHLDRWGRDRLRAELRRSVIVETLRMRR